MSAVMVGEQLSLAACLAVAQQRATVALSPAAVSRIADARGVVDASLNDGHAHYGINTGFGALAEVRIDLDQLRQLQLNLVRSHATGVGAPLPQAVVRLAMLLRAQVLSAGHSGVRQRVIDQLIDLLNAGVHPLIPCQGSVGASGDLAPLAHLALTLIGEGKCEYQGRLRPASEVLSELGIAPVVLEAKEGLCLINGTQVMTAIAIVAQDRAERLCRAVDIAGAMTIDAMLGSVTAFDPRIQRLRRHAGQEIVADNLRRLCADSPLNASHADCDKVQDPYSMRCIPQVHGATRDTLAHVRSVLEIEVDSVTDNPLIFPGDDDGDVPEGAVLSGGNFHGMPVAAVCDFARISLTSLGSISERRVEQMVNPHLNNGLPPFLTRESGLNSGLMIAQVTATALVSECKGLSMPASVDSIPSSASREDHVSMGPIAARRFMDVVENVERVVAIELLCAAQAIDLRAPTEPSPASRAAVDAIREVMPFLAQDRVMYEEMEAVAELMRSGRLEAAVTAVVGVR
ncbi:MAG: histidine ammonia-lyase [Myxococcales bacterium]|nr:histidine ammonia-lyase [Myxococcales bacterium]